MSVFSFKNAYIILSKHIKVVKAMALQFKETAISDLNEWIG